MEDDRPDAVVDPLERCCNTDNVDGADASVVASTTVQNVILRFLAVVTGIAARLHRVHAAERLSGVSALP